MKDAAPGRAGSGEPDADRGPRTAFAPAVGKRTPCPARGARGGAPTQPRRTDGMIRGVRSPAGLGSPSRRATADEPARRHLDRGGPTRDRPATRRGCSTADRRHRPGGRPGSAGALRAIQSSPVCESVRTRPTDQADVEIGGGGEVRSRHEEGVQGCRPGPCRPHPECGPRQRSRAARKSGRGKERGGRAGSQRHYHRGDEGKPPQEGTASIRQRAGALRWAACGRLSSPPGSSATTGVCPRASMERRWTRA